MRLESATPQRALAASKIEEGGARNAVAKRGSPERPVTRSTWVASAACDTAGDAPTQMAVTTATAHHPLPTTHSPLTPTPAIAGSPTPHPTGPPAAGTPPACPTARGIPERA